MAGHGTTKLHSHLPKGCLNCLIAGKQWSTATMFREGMPYQYHSWIQNFQRCILEEGFGGQSCIKPQLCTETHYFSKVTDYCNSCSQPEAGHQLHALKTKCKLCSTCFEYTTWYKTHILMAVGISHWHKCKQTTKEEGKFYPCLVHTMLMGQSNVSKKSILLEWNAKPSRTIIFIFRHRAEDYLLKKSTISKCWSKWRRDGLMQRTLSDWPWCAN